MKTTPVRFFAHALSAASLAISAAVGAQTMGVSVSPNADAMPARYGSFVNPLASVPLSVRLENGAHSFEVTLPYEHTLTERTAFVSALSTPMPQPHVGAAGAAAPGEASVAWQYSRTLEGDPSLFLDFTTRLAFDMRGPERGVTPEPPRYLAQLAIGREIGRVTPRIELGYSFQRASAQPLAPSTAYSALAASYRTGASSSIDLFFDVRQRSAFGEGSERSIGAHWTQRVSRNMRVAAYAFKNLTHDRGFASGVQVAIGF